VSDPTPTKLGKRLSLFGDLPTRFLRFGLKVAPGFMEPALIAAWSSVFFLIAKSQRRAVQSNLRALHPNWGPLLAFGGAWCVFWNFAYTYVDALRCDTGTGEVDWAIDGIPAFDDLARRNEGCLILTAHMGNYDLAAPLFSSRFGRTIYAVRAPERQPEMQAIREEELRKKEAANPQFRALYNTSDNHLGLVLARLLSEGNIVAVQGDRIEGFDLGNSPLEYLESEGAHVIITTTNGTVALQACAAGGTVLVGALSNLRAVAAAVRSLNPGTLLAVCSGTGDGVALEDVWAAGALAEHFPEAEWSDAALTAQAVKQALPDAGEALRRSSNGRALLAKDRGADIEWCASLDRFEAVGMMREGVVGLFREGGVA
jgi:phosphosulfolactate phosphohydrolase-like enzyme